MGRMGKTPKREQIGKRHYECMVAFPSGESIANALGMSEAEMMNEYGSITEAVRAVWGPRMAVWFGGRWQTNGE